MAEETTTTATTATTTGGGQESTTQAGGAGAGTGTVTNQTQANDQHGTSDPKVAAALKTLEEAGVLGKDVYTKAQHDGHMGAARRQWQTDADKKAQEATAEAQRKAQEEQGQFEPLYTTAQGIITQHEATIKEKETLISSLSTHVNADIDALVKNLPPVLKELDPGADNLAARMDWIAKIRKHPEALGQGTLPPRQPAHGNGLPPRPAGPTTPADPRPPVSRKTF